MEAFKGNSASWQDDILESTDEPGISVSMIAEEAPTLTVSTIVGVTLAVLVAIAAMFLLGVLIDWRQQRLLEKRLGEVKRPRSQRRASSHPDGDAVSIANNMEVPELSLPPAEALRDIP